MSEEVVVAVPATVEEGTFESYDEMVNHFKDKIENISKVTLKICWEMGVEVNRIKESAVYGAKTVEHFLTSLDLPGLDIKRLYRYGQFAKEYTKDELVAALDKKHVGWGVIHKLISVKDKEDRKEFEDKIANEEIKPSELEQELSVYQSEQAAANAEEEGDTTPASTGSSSRRSYIKNMKKATSTLEILKNTLPLALKDMDDLDEIANDDDKYDKALEYVYALREAIEEVERPLSEVQEKAARLA
jgi:hypothetical protein